jgi:small subunit ribosomal protein S8
MSLSDPIADFLTSIRNAVKAQKEAVTVPTSKVRNTIAEILKEEKFIENFKIIEEGPKRFLRIHLRYLKGKKSAIKHIRRISLPGLRRYVETKKIPRVLNGLGIVILSTSRGMVTGEKARELNIGGEVVCKVW